MSARNADISLTFAGADQCIAVVRLARPAKRNALSDGLIAALRDIFQTLPDTVRAAVIDGEGEHFCAGLDLSELKERDAGQGVHHSRHWHSAVDAVQFGPVPVIAALHGAVVGGGLELASAAHIRVADETTFFALPEGRQHSLPLGSAVRISSWAANNAQTEQHWTGHVREIAASADPITRTFSVKVCIDAPPADAPALGSTVRVQPPEKASAEPA